MERHLKKIPHKAGLMKMIELDPRADQHETNKAPRPLPYGELRPIQIDDNPTHQLYISAKADPA